MKSAFAYKFATALAAVGVLPLMSPGVAQAIVSGRLDGDGHPNVGAYVTLRYDNPEFPLDLPDVNGGGMLIHPRVVLTCGHCTALLEHELADGFYALDDIKFTFGSDGKDPTTWLDIVDYITHPGYNAKTNIGSGAPPLADVGVLILREPVEGIAPVTLAPEGFLDSLAAAGVLRSGNPAEGAIFAVVGYGTHGEAPNNYLPPDGLRRVAESRYKLHSDQWLFVDANTAHGNAGTMSGDSGGAAFWVDPQTGEELLVGITSRGDWNGVALGIKYSTDTAELLDFVSSIIVRVEAGEFDAVSLRSVSVVPEPTPFALCAMGASAMSFPHLRMRRKRADQIDLRFSCPNTRHCAPRA